MSLLCLHTLVALCASQDHSLQEQELTGSLIIHYARQSPLSMCYTPTLMGMAKIKMWLTMKLRKAQERGVGFEERIIWKYFSQICDAIKHMHDRRSL